ncbi:MAG: PIG-L family deacetylase [Acidimicrobiales bacterium]
MAHVRDIEPGAQRVVLIVVAHADDPTLFVGGTIARWADAGWRVVVVRATDDRWDSVGLSETETIERSALELQQAAHVLRIHRIVDLGMATDSLGDASEVALREQIIREIRRWKPYALVTFDPYAMYGEDNQDHVLVAAATDEAFWTSQFDKHHPEQTAQGLAPHGCFERWYFGRRVIDVTDVVDTTDTLERKVDAALCHDAALRNLVHQLRLQAHTGGWQIPALDTALDGDLRPVVEPLIRGAAQRTGARYGLNAAEEFRIVRFGGLADFLTEHGQPLDRFPDSPT